MQVWQRGTGEQRGPELHPGTPALEGERLGRQGTSPGSGVGLAAQMPAVTLGDFAKWSGSLCLPFRRQ